MLHTVVDAMPRLIAENEIGTFTCRESLISRHPIIFPIILPAPRAFIFRSITSWSCCCVPSWPLDALSLPLFLHSASHLECSCCDSSSTSSCPPCSPTCMAYALVAGDQLYLRLTLLRMSIRPDITRKDTVRPHTSPIYRPLSGVLTQTLLPPCPQNPQSYHLSLASLRDVSKTEVKTKLHEGEKRRLCGPSLRVRI